MDPSRRNIQRDFIHVSKYLSGQDHSKERREARKLTAWIHPRTDGRVLDAACGTGTLAFALASVTAHVAALDLVPDMIRAEIKTSSPASSPPQPSFTVGRVERLPYRNRQFDLVICANSFANFPQPLQILKELHRVTRRTGRIVVIDIVAPEDPEKCAYLNRLEARRGHSFTRIMRQAEFLELFRRGRLRLTRCRLQRRAQSLREWLRLSPAAADPKRERKLREQVLDSTPGDLAGLQPRRIRGEVVIHHSTAWFVLRHQ